jgi:hypothetical protein
MAKLWDIIQGIEQGIASADKNLGVYRQAVEADELKELKRLQQEQKNLEKQEKDRQADIKREIGLLNQEKRLLKEDIGKFKNIPGVKSEQKTRIKQINKRIEELTLLELGAYEDVPSSLAQESKIKQELPNSSPTYQKPDTPEYENLSQEEYDQGQKLLKWMTGGKPSDALKSIPSSFMETAEGITGLVGAKSLKEKIRDTKNKYEDLVGIEDRDAAYAQGGRLLGDILTPAGWVSRASKLSKLGKYVPKVLKPSLKGAAYGAIQSEKEDENPLLGAAMGAGTSAALQGVGKGLSAAKKARFKKIADKASFKDRETIAARAETMGPKATIPELVSVKTEIENIKKDGSLLNQKRLRKIKENIEKKAQKSVENLPQGEEELQTLYKNLGEMVDPNVEGSVAQRSAKLYDAVKEESLGGDGLVDKKSLMQWIRAAKEAEPNVKGLPKLKTNRGKVDEVEKLLMQAPENPKLYRKFVTENIEKIPTASDFLRYRSSVNKMLGKAGSEQIEGLSVLSNSLDQIVDKADVNNVLKKASTHYATELGPLKQKQMKKAASAVKFSESTEGKPSISKVFGEHSTENNRAFKQLSKEDKKRVLGAFLEENMESEIDPIRDVTKTYKKLPSYIKDSKDPTTRAIVKDMKNIAAVNKTYTSMQRSTTPDIGSRVPTKSMKNLMRLIGYGGTAFVNPTMTAGIALADMGVKGGAALAKAARRKGVGQKYLKYYFKPELLDELYRKRMGRLSKPPTKLIIENKKKEKGNDY